MSSLFDILVMSEFFKIAKWAKFVRNWVSSKNHPKFDIPVMSAFFKIAKWAKLVWKCFSYKHHLKFDILVMSEFFKIAKWAKLVIYIGVFGVMPWNSPKNQSFQWCVPYQNCGDFDFFLWILQLYTKNTYVHYKFCPFCWFEKLWQFCPFGWFEKLLHD